MQTTKPLLLALAVFLAVLALTHIHASRQAERERESLSDRLASECRAKAGELQSEVRHLVDAARLMAAWVPVCERRGIPMETAAAAAIASFEGVERIGLAPGGVLATIYPQAGYEGGRGKDLFNDPERRFASRESLRNKESIVSGPFTASSGKACLVAQTPVSLADDPEEKFWGFVTALAGVENLARRAGLDTLASSGLLYRLEKGSGSPGESVLVTGAAEALPVGVTLPLDVPGIRLALTVGPDRPPPSAWDQWPAYLGGAALGACMAGLTFALALQPQRLRALVERRTRRLRKVNERLAREIRARRRISRELEASLELTRGMFENSPAVKLLVDPLDLRVADANPAAERFFGWSRQELAGMPLESFNLLPKETLGRTVALAMRGEGAPYPARYRLASGEERDVEIYSGPIRRDGALLLQSVIHDVTAREQARRELRDSRARLESIFDAVDSAIVEIDAKGGVSLVNQGFSDLFGYSPMQARGLTLYDLAPASEHAACAEMHAKVMGGAVSRACMLKRFVRAGGQEFWGSVCFGALPGETGEPRGCVAAITDVTALMEARKGAEEANQAKGRFLANISHEIRSPMNAIMGLTELTLRTPLAPTQQENLQKILEASRVLLKVLESVLDYSSMEAGGLRLREAGFEPSRAALAALAKYGDKARAVGIGLRAEGLDTLPERLVGDPDRLEQVLAVLVGNAVKFTREGEVVLEASLEAQDGRTARIGFSVSDTGIGMDPSRVAELCQPFVQAESGMTRSFGGAGLGLAIASRLLALMGSELRAESEPGRGSTFSFSVELPLAGGGGESPGRHRQDDLSALTEGLAGKRVLVVDDNDLGRHTGVEMLRLGSVIPAGAESGAKALEMLAAQGFDAVLMDIQMPGMDGFETLRRLRRLPGCEALPVIAVTGHAREEDRRESLASGMAGHVSKPYTPAALFAALRGVLAGPDREDRCARALDSTRALALLMGNSELYGRLLKGFVREYEGAAALMRAHAASGAREEMRALAFAIKGLAANLGGVRLGAAAQVLEQALASGVPGEVSPVLEEFGQALEEFVALAARTGGELHPG